MKNYSIIALLTFVMIGITFTSCVSKKSTVSVQSSSVQQSSSELLTSEIDSVSFILGKFNASQMKKNMEKELASWPVKGSIEALNAGFMDGIKNVDDTLFLGKDMQSLNEYMGTFFQRLEQAMAEAQIAEGEKYLVENKTKSGVKTTDSGLQYKVITEGTGERPRVNDVVRIHYIGKFIDGTVFDSSVERGEPIELAAGDFVMGFTEGLLLMSVGSKYQLWIPSELGYGDQGNQAIKPNSVLEFEVELLEIVK